MSPPQNSDDLYDFPAGSVVPGTRWTVRREVGRGGMGIVLEVFRKELPAVRAAMKILCWAGESPDSEHLFVRELELLSRLRHPNIVEVKDFGTTATDEPYFLMQLLEGPTLRKILNEAKRRRQSDDAFVHPSLRPTAVWKIVRDVCAGLARAHTLGIVHRDIKADNIILHRRRPGAGAVLFDFGIAASRVAAGTPRYIGARGSPKGARDGAGRPLCARDLSLRTAHARDASFHRARA